MKLTPTAGAAYIYADGSPETALYFLLYPDKQALSGGTVIARKTIPGFAREVITPLGRKSVDEKISLLFSDAMPWGDKVTAPHTQAALDWIMRHLGPGDDDEWGDDDSNVFVIKLRQRAERFVVERWSADIQILRPDANVDGNMVVHMRVDLDCVHYTTFGIDTSIFGELKGAVRKKKPKSKKEKKPTHDAQGRKTENHPDFKEVQKGDIGHILGKLLAERSRTEDARQRQAAAAAAAKRSAFRPTATQPSFFKD